MLVKEIILLNAVTATDTATSGTLRFVYKTLQFIGMTTATAKVQVSNDGSNWLNHLVDINTDTAISINNVYSHLRVIIDEYTAGTISVKLSMRE